MWRISKTITEFIALKPKLYSILCEEDQSLNKKKAKGVKRCAAKKITHENYKRCLEAATIIVNGTEEQIKVAKEDAIQYASFKNFESKNHKISTTTTNKISLCCYDTKRYYLDTVSSLPFGHYATLV